MLDRSECLQIGFGGQQILTGFQSLGNGNASPPGGCSYRVTKCGSIPVGGRIVR